ncbi:MAG: HupE/UreJ family protein [Candidatus Binatia bacterium]
MSKTAPCAEMMVSDMLRASMRVILAAAAVVCIAMDVPSAFAHALDPVLFELREKPDGGYDVTWKAPNAKIPGVNLVAVLPPECRTIGEVERRDEDDATISTWTIDCGGSLVGKTVGIDGLESTDALLRIAMLSGAVDRRVLGADHARVTVAAEPSRFDVLREYGRLGIEHIAGGIDHLLFVFGLLLLTGGTRQLVATVTAFTLGHSVTLALAALGLVSVPQGPVEVVIAVTIFILAVELARDVGPRATLLRRRPWAMAFSFGLLHGLGFAGALREAGLPASDVPLALLSFNLGIEIGQLAFVAVVLVVLAVLRSVLASMPPWLGRVPLYAMGTASAYWILERAAALV